MREYQSAADDLGFPSIRIELLAGIANIPSPEETGDTFAENASLKAAYYSLHAGGLVFADDSGISVDALDGAPGVYSARFAGVGSSDSANLQLLLARMAGQSDRRAHFTCAIALAEGGKVLQVFEDRADGVLLDSPAGSGGFGFGYDPVFFYPELQKTFAEIEPAAKLAVSHRGKALRQLLAYTLARGLHRH